MYIKFNIKLKKLAIESLDKELHVPHFYHKIQREQFYLYILLWAELCLSSIHVEEWTQGPASLPVTIT